MTNAEWRILITWITFAAMGYINFQVARAEERLYRLLATRCDSQTDADVAGVPGEPPATPTE